MKKLFLNIIFLSIPFLIMSYIPGNMKSFKKTYFKKQVNTALTSYSDELQISKVILDPSDTTIYYPYVKICCNIWMKKNLDIVTYRNGDTIPKVEDAAQWAALTTGAYCYYNNDSTTYDAIYGKLYNWYAVNDPRGLAPEGWHVPTVFEMESTTKCLGDIYVTSGSLKEMGTTHWLSPNTGATNITDFTALPGGNRIANGTFENIGSSGLWWNSTGSTYLLLTGWYYRLDANSDDILSAAFPKRYGLSVRILKD